MSRRQEKALKLREAVAALIAGSQRTFRANVVRLDPLTLELLASNEGDALLEIDDDFDMTRGLRKLHDDVPLAIDDTVLLHKHNGHYAAFDVLTDSDL